MMITNQEQITQKKYKDPCANVSLNIVDNTDFLNAVDDTEESPYSSPTNARANSFLNAVDDTEDSTYSSLINFVSNKNSDPTNSKETKVAHLLPATLIEFSSSSSVSCIPPLVALTP